MVEAIRIALAAHADNPARLRHRIDAALTRGTTGGLSIAYAIHGEPLDLRIPSAQSPALADALWRTTCCELFVSGDGTSGYREFNFSPSGQWASYDFGAYRLRLPDSQAIPPVTVQSQCADEDLKVEAALPAAALPIAGELRMGVSVVLEGRDGAFGYWALRHAPGRPDFHHPDSFALHLGACGFTVAPAGFLSAGR